MKTCPDCGSTTNTFGIDRSKDDGLMVKCKPCVRIQVRRRKDERKVLGIKDKPRIKPPLIPVDTLEAGSAWYKRAACLHMDPDIFFNPPYQEAKIICAGCPVRRECLAAALREEANLWPQGYNLIYGFRGGTRPMDRYPTVIKLARDEFTYKPRNRFPIQETSNG